MAVAATTWRRAFLILLAVVVVGVPLFTFEFFLAFRGSPEIASHLIDLAQRCKVAVENRQPFDATGLSQHIDHDRRQLVDDQYQLEVTLEGFGTDQPRYCAVGRGEYLPLAGVRIAEVLLAFMKVRSASVRTGNYKPSDLGAFGDSIFVGFEAVAPNRYGCVIKSYVSASPEDFNLTWVVGEARKSDGTGCL